MKSIAVEIKPIFIGLPDAVLKHVVELPKAAAGVIEDSIKDDTDIFLMRFL